MIATWPTGLLTVYMYCSTCDGVSGVLRRSGGCTEECSKLLVVTCDLFVLLAYSVVPKRPHTRTTYGVSLWMWRSDYSIQLADLVQRCPHVVHVVVFFVCQCILVRPPSIFHVRGRARLLLSVCILFACPPKRTGTGLHSFWAASGVLGRPNNYTIKTSQPADWACMMTWKGCTSVQASCQAYHPWATPDKPANASSYGRIIAGLCLY